MTATKYTARFPDLIRQGSGGFARPLIIRRDAEPGLAMTCRSQASEWLAGHVVVMPLWHAIFDDAILVFVGVFKESSIAAFAGLEAFGRITKFSSLYVAILDCY